jgi:hypothetical protein
MRKSGGDLDLAQEALGADGAREIGVQDLHRDAAVVAQVLGEVHDGHATSAEFALQPVAVAESLGEVPFRFGHTGPLPCIIRQRSRKTLLPSAAATSASASAWSRKPRFSAFAAALRTACT